MSNVKELSKRNFKVVIVLIGIAGILDFITTFIGVRYLGFYESNLINREFFLVGIPIWVCFNILVVLVMSRAKTKLALYGQLFILVLSYHAPLNNLYLILGVIQ